ncbi:MAG: S-layer homology domain-containing protein [Bacillota bacterium]
MKKLLISILAALMVLSFTGTAFAAASVTKVAFSDIAGHKAEFELTVLAALGVYSGDSGIGGAVKPDDPITRAQFCKVLVLATGKGALAQGLMGLKPNVKDEVPSWAWGYVNVAIYMGVIKGYEDGTFRANNTVSYAEAVTMLVRALPMHDKFVGTEPWPYNYLFYGIEKGFTGTVEVGFPNLPATRGDIARMLYATMGLAKVDKDGNTVTGSAILHNRVVTGTLSDYNLATNSVNIGGALTLADTVYLAGATSLESLMNLAVVAVKDSAGKICAIGKSVAASTYTGVFAGRDDTTTPKVLKFADGTTIPYGGSGTVPVRLNGDLADSGGTAYKDSALQPGDECVVTRGADGSAVFIVATHWLAQEHLTLVTPSTSSSDTQITGSTSGVKEVPATALVTVNGASANRDTLAKWDVVQLALNAAGKAYGVRAVRRTVEGTVSAKWETYPGPVKYVTIGGVTYVSNLTLNVGTYYKLALDKDGKIFVEIETTPQTPFVKVKSYTLYSDGTAQAVVDVRGATATYSVPDLWVDDDGVAGRTAGDSELRAHVQAAATAGGFAWIKVDPLQNKIIDFVEVTAWGTAYSIVANSGGNITLDKTGGAYEFLPASLGIACYKGSTYVDAASLGVGTGYTLAQATLGTAHDFDAQADTITVTLYNYTTP